MPIYKCPRCRQRYLTTVDVNKNCPQLRCNNAELQDSRRKPGSPARNLKSEARKLAVIKARRDARYETLRALRAVKPNYYEGPTEEDDEETVQMLEEIEEKEEAKDAADFDFAPDTERWNFDQRLTSDDMVERTVYPANLSPIRPFRLWHAIAAAVPGERQKQCGAIMGSYLGVNSINAHGVSRQAKVPIGRPWAKGEKNTAEWCHLAGVALGGLTTWDNLVAASYSANTYMGVVEKQLQGRTNLQILVTIHGVPATVSTHPYTDHVAERIEYAIQRRSDGKEVWRVMIDARIKDFSDADRVRVENVLKPLLGSK